jgi:hypothetical protein
LIITPAKTDTPTIIIAIPAGMTERVEITELEDGIITGKEANAIAVTFDLILAIT